jgi:YVTN family beta-propeller protein
MSRRLNYRLVFLSLLLAGVAALLIGREHRPSFLRPGLHLNAYVANAGDGTVSVVDLARLSTVATISTGPGTSALRALA